MERYNFSSTAPCAIPRLNGTCIRYLVWINASTPAMKPLFSILFTNSGYWPAKTDEMDRKKTDSTFYQELWRFIRMPVVLCNALDTFQRTVHVILFTMRWRLVLVYLGGIVLFFKSPQKRIGHIQTVLTLLRNSGVTLEMKKQLCFTKTIVYQGHNIRPRPLEIAAHITDSITGLQ